MADRRVRRRRVHLEGGPRGALVMALALGVLASATAASAERLRGTYLGGGVGRRVAFQRGGRDRNAWAGTLRFKLDSGEELLAFCIQLDVGVRSGNRYKSDGPVVELPNGCQIANVLDNYPAKADLSADEAAARQLAVWHFSDDVDLATIPDAYQDIRDRATFIAYEAAEGACLARRTSAPDLRITPESAEVEVGQAIEYRVSADELAAGETVQATLSGPAVFEDGGQARELVLDDSGSAVVLVTSTAVGETELVVELPYTLEGGTVFSEIDASQPSQRLVLAEDFGLTARAKATGRWLEKPTPTPVTPTETTAPRTATAATTASATATTERATEAASATITPVLATATPVATVTAGRRRATEAVATPVTTRIIPEQMPRTGGGSSVAEGGPGIRARGGTWAVVLVALLAVGFLVWRVGVK